MLATMSERPGARDLCGSTGLRRRTAHTITDIDSLLANLALVAAMDSPWTTRRTPRASSAWARRSSATTVPCAGAVSVTGIKGDLPAWRVNELGQAVRRSADQVSRDRSAARLRRPGPDRDGVLRMTAAAMHGQRCARRRGPGEVGLASAPDARRRPGETLVRAGPGRPVRHRPGDHRRRRSIPPSCATRSRSGTSGPGSSPGDSPLAGRGSSSRASSACGHCARCARGRDQPVRDLRRDRLHQGRRGRGPDRGAGRRSSIRSPTAWRRRTPC